MVLLWRVLPAFGLQNYCLCGFPFFSPTKWRYFSQKNICPCWYTVAVFLLAYAFFIVNAGVEEYALPFIMVSLYLFSKYFFHRNEKLLFLN
ncbi:MAG: hypothetical protein Pg6C_16090 [Treponemataceae bacterium]|nr:MAG: hypothetical protein Pg6C_16090 [Treponemataceae bacterium]